MQLSDNPTAKIRLCTACGARIQRVKTRLSGPIDWPAMVGQTLYDVSGRAVAIVGDVRIKDERVTGFLHVGISAVGLTDG